VVNSLIGSTFVEGLGRGTMHLVAVRFFRCDQQEQVYGVANEYMSARLGLQIAVDGQLKGTFDSDVKLTTGGRYNTDAIEASWPTGYDGPFNYEAFQAAATRYYRGLVGQQNAMFSLGNSRNVLMANNRIETDWVVAFQAEESRGGPW
jgi:hypothetical protein